MGNDKTAVNKNTDILQNKKKKPFYKSIAFWIVLIVIFAIAGGSGGKSKTNYSSTLSTDKGANTKKVELVDFSQMSDDNIANWCKDNNLKCNVSYEYSDSVANGGYIRQTVKAGDKTSEGSVVTVYRSQGKAPTTEQANALKKAESYSKTMHMSKAGIYDQLVSEYGEQFAAADAQYAVDNLKADYNQNALEKAKSYQESMQMSKSAIYDQLVSEYGEKFTPEEAQYAIDNL